MCSLNAGNLPIGSVKKKYRPTKERRFNEEFLPNSVTGKLRDAGLSGPFVELLSAGEEMKWNEKDNAKYVSGTGMPAARLSNPQVTAPVERQRDFILNSKNNLETASDYKSKKEGSGSKKKGGGGSLRIKQKPKLNTQNNPQSGLNI